jgi:Protein of unknown function (DUF3568)
LGTALPGCCRSEKQPLIRMNRIGKLLQIPAIIALAAALSMASGCFVAAVGAAGAAGAGTVAYVRGELEAHVGHPFEAVANAADNAVVQLQFAKISEARDAFSAKIVARTAEDKKVEIAVERESDNLTKVTIRIGTFGDEEKSRAFLEEMKARL